jgi:signal transduction histidine kinase
MDTGREAAARELGRTIDERLGEIEHQWLEQVRREIVRHPGVELTELRDGIPDYLRALVNVLTSGAKDLHDDAKSAWSTIAREHGVTRVRIGFDIQELVREFIVLRRVIRQVMREQRGVVEGPEAVLADVLDGAISAAVQAYVDARDYEARREQATRIGFLTHELRTPLSTAVLATSQLRRNGASEQGRLLDTLDRNLAKLGELLDSVLLTQKMEAGEVRSQPVPVKLGQVVEGALEGARQVTAQKGVDLRVEYDPDVTVTLDPVLTRSALQNLADNAAKYTDAGHVDVSVRDRPDEIAVDVRDTCGGLSAEELRTIFEPFKRGNTQKAGTGLGLAIARRAVEAQGGSIHAESPGAAGCHFSITLPKRR